MAGEVIYGIRAVEEALRAEGRVNRLYIAKESHARESRLLVDLAREGRIRFDYVPQAKLNELTGTWEHQGVAAEVSPVGYISLEHCLEKAGRFSRLLALDQVQHSRNVGMILRAAWGAGAGGVLLAARGGALLDDTVTRSSAGGVFHVPVVNSMNIAQSLRRVRDEGYWVYGLDGGGKEDIFEVSWPERVVLVAGNETGGLRPGVIKACDTTVRIPLAVGVDSLNVAIAASIALFQVAHAHQVIEKESG